MSNSAGKTEGVARWGVPGMTLIEVLVATSIALLVMLTAFAGFRAIVKVIGAANQTMLENAAFRAGFAGAMDEVDFWPSQFDPSGARLCHTAPGFNYPSNTLNRDTGAATNPGPFKQLKFTTAGGDPPAVRRPGSTFVGSGLVDGKCFWRWKANDPRTWYRTNVIANSVAIRSVNNNAQGIDWLGREYDVSRVDFDYATTPSGAKPTYAPAASDVSWYPSIVDHLWYQTGLYGMVDMLPAGCPTSYYGRYYSAAEWDGEFSWPTSAGIGLTGSPAWPHPSFYNHPYVPYPGRDALLYTDTVNGTLLAYGNRLVPFIRRTMTSPSPTSPSWPNRSMTKQFYPPMDPGRWAFTYFAPTAAITSKPMDPSELNYPWQQRVARHHFQAGVAASAQEVLTQCGVSTILNPSRPEGVPQITVRSTRYFAYGRFVTNMKVMVFNPATGRSTTLSFNTTGTTLRGARQNADIGALPQDRLNR